MEPIENNTLQHKTRMKVGATLGHKWDSTGSHSLLERSLAERVWSPQSEKALTSGVEKRCNREERRNKSPMWLCQAPLTLPQQHASEDVIVFGTDVDRQSRAGSDPGSGVR